MGTQTTMAKKPDSSIYRKFQCCMLFILVIMLLPYFMPACMSPTSLEDVVKSKIHGLSEDQYEIRHVFIETCKLDLLDKPDAKNALSILSLDLGTSVSTDPDSMGCDVWYDEDPKIKEQIKKLTNERMEIHAEFSKKVPRGYYDLVWSRFSHAFVATRSVSDVKLAVAEIVSVNQHKLNPTSIKTTIAKIRAAKLRIGSYGHHHDPDAHARNNWGIPFPQTCWGWFCLYVVGSLLKVLHKEIQFTINKLPTTIEENVTRSFRTPQFDSERAVACWHMDPHKPKVEAENDTFELAQMRHESDIAYRKLMSQIKARGYYVHPESIPAKPVRFEKANTEKVKTEKSVPSQAQQSRVMHKTPILKSRSVDTRNASRAMPTIDTDAIRQRASNRLI